MSDYLFDYFLNYEVPKPFKIKDFLMDLRGIEPLSESPSIAVSPITVVSLSFPPLHARRQAYSFSSFMIRPHTQSLAYVVSCMIDAWVTGCRCPASDSCLRQRLLNYLQRLYLWLHLARCLRMAATISKPPSKPLQALRHVKQALYEIACIFILYATLPIVKSN